MSFVDKYMSYYQDAKEVLSLFNNQYAIIPAFTATTKNQAYQLRHKIYCHELGYEPKTNDEVERDAFDSISTQIILHFKPLNMPVGCVRFVHGWSKRGQFVLPMEDVCGDSLDHAALQRIKDSGHHYAEISRLGIDKAFRHMGRTREKSKLHSPVRSSCALIALLLGVQAYAKISDTKYLLAIVERRLWNTMKKLGIPITPMGEGVDHRGKRFPIMIDRDEVEKIIPMLMWPLYNNVQRDMKKIAALYRDPVDSGMSLEDPVTIDSVREGHHLPIPEPEPIIHRGLMG